MKIVYCVSQLYNSAGMERILIGKINWLVSHGHTVTVVTTDNKGRPTYFPLDKKVRTIDLGLNYFDDYSFNPLKWRLVTLRKKKKHKRMLTDILNEIQPDITISTFAEESSFLYKIKSAGKTVIEFHFIRNLFRINPRKGLIRRTIDEIKNISAGNLVKKYDAFVVLTDSDRKAWGSLGNCHVIPNFNTMKSGNCSDLNSGKVIACGRLSKEKGFDRLLRVWKRVVSKQPDWTLEIYGDGPERDYLNSLILESGLVHNVKLCGTTDKLDEKMSESSICAVSSLYEGFSMVIVEALSVGLPVVAFNVDCGPKSIIRHGENGFLVSDGDEEEFANVILRLMESEELRRKIGENAVKDSKHYDCDEVMQQWIDLFENL